MNSLQFDSCERSKLTKAIEEGVDTLYHYQRYNEEHIIDLLKNRRIFCSNLGNLNDPWDCRFCFKIDDPQSASRAIATFRQVARPSGKGPDYDRIMDEELENPEMLRKVTGETVDALEAHNVQWRRIYCLTRDPCSTLMWSHYAENHKGICIEFAVSPNNVFATALKVLYKKELLPSTICEHTETALLPFFVKAECWSYEEEYRLFLRIHDANAPHPVREDMRVIDDKLLISEGSLTSIIIGCHTPHEIGVRIRQIADEFWPSVKVKQMHRHHDKYQLEIGDFIA